MEIEFVEVSSNKFNKISFTIKKNKINGIYADNDILKLIDYGEFYSGKILFDNTILTNSNKKEYCKSIALIPQNFTKQIFLNTVEEYISYILKCYKLKITKEKVCEVLEEVGLDDKYLTKDVNTLSTSEEKLLQITCCLLRNVKLLLLDNPFLKLDIKCQKRIMRILEKLKTKTTIVINTFDSNILYKYTDNIIIFNKKQVLKEINSKKLGEIVKELLENDIEVPEIILFTYKANLKNNKKLEYHRDIRDLIKDVYKNV